LRPGESLVLVEELTHRVINEFTHAILSIDEVAARVSDREAKEALSDAIGILRAYSAAHRALQAPRTPGQMDLCDYLSRVCAGLSAAHLLERGVRVTLRHADVRLAAPRCWRMGLIIAELVNNSVRHSFGGGAGEIVIELVVDGDALLCRVEDNGRADIKAQPARGRFLVEALAADLGGEAAWRFSARGTTVLLTVPTDSAAGCESHASMAPHVPRQRSNVEVFGDI
jgi:two-component sensor histidine kinase